MKYERYKEHSIRGVIMMKYLFTEELMNGFKELHKERIERFDKLHDYTIYDLEKESHNGTISLDTYIKDKHYLDFLSIEGFLGYIKTNPIFYLVTFISGIFLIHLTVKELIYLFSMTEFEYLPLINLPYMSKLLTLGIVYLITIIGTFFISEKIYHARIVDMFKRIEEDGLNNQIIKNYYKFDDKSKYPKLYINKVYYEIKLGDSEPILKRSDELFEDFYMSYLHTKSLNANHLFYFKEEPNEEGNFTFKMGTGKLFHNLKEFLITFEGSKFYRVLELYLEYLKDKKLIKEYSINEHKWNTVELFSEGFEDEYIDMLVNNYNELRSISSVTILVEHIETYLDSLKEQLKTVGYIDTELTQVTISLDKLDNDLINLLKISNDEKTTKQLNSVKADLQNVRNLLTLN